MSQVPEGLYYTKDHEWLRPEADGKAVVGITDYAQTSLGDVTFVELPMVGAHIATGSQLGVVESVKAASDIYMPASGTVLAVNDALASSPDLINSDPYGKGWLALVKLDATDVSALLGADAYRALV